MAFEQYAPPRDMSTTSTLLDQLERIVQEERTTQLLKYIVPFSILAKGGLSIERFFSQPGYSPYARHSNPMRPHRCAHLWRLGLRTERGATE